MRSIGIVGGGIGGLTLAAALDPSRWRVTLHEARPERSSRGTALGLWPDVLAQLDPLALGDPLRTPSQPITELAVRDAAGRVLGRVQHDDAWLIDRSALLDVLRSRVPTSTRHLTATVGDPREVDAEVLVGADGVHSVVRRHTWPGSASRRTGHVALRGVAHRPTDDMVEIWAGGGLSAMSEGRSNWYVAGRRDPAAPSVDELSDEAAHQAALTMARPFGPDLVDTVLATPPDAVLHQDIWVTPARWSLTRGRVVLIGDAAHAMAPNLGRGACEAMIDALTLARCLDGAPRTSDAFAAYQRTRAARTQAIRAAARGVMALALARRGAGIRDGVLARLARPARTDA